MRNTVDATSRMADIQCAGCLTAEKSVERVLHAPHVLLLLLFRGWCFWCGELWQVICCASLAELAVGKGIEHLVDLALSFFFHLVLVFAQHARVERVFHELFHDASLW